MGDSGSDISMSVPDVVFERHQNRSLLSQGIVKKEEEEYVEEKPHDEEYVGEEKRERKQETMTKDKRR